MCDMLLADLHLREGDISTAKTLFKTCLGACNYSQIKSYCLEQLVTLDAGSWTTVYLAHCTKFKQKLGINKALQFLGDVFLAQADEDTAAVESWDAARPLFEWSSQIKGVELIDERLASVGKDLLEQYRMNLARLVEINPPTGMLEGVEGDLSDMEDLGGAQSLATV
ncbi:hypothetical protein B0H14DRAFT_2592142 [Mycena olivaceomarginata]|nr:hypothetical protein B0H14DRAFT_2592142 [Mycena olivaceomarginata]